MKGKLSPYDLMVVSKYFETIDDFINMELGITKARCNMEKFHFNPIALDEWSRQFFTSLETLHVYTKEDNTFPEETFYQIIIHFPIEYKEWVEKKKENEIYKHVILEEETSEALETIPEGITEIENDCFSERDDLEELIIPDSVTSIRRGFLCECEELTAMTIPTH